MNNELKLIVEALIMAHGAPLSLDRIANVFPEEERPSNKDLQKIIQELQEDYKDRAIELKLLASGYSFQTKKQFNSWITELFAEKPPKYSNALLEVLAIIAYKQPVTRADIENIRGVALSSSIIKTLLDREWVEIAGTRDVPGKPLLYKTTKEFLDYFNLKALNELPELDEGSPKVEEQITV